MLKIALSLSLICCFACGGAASDTTEPAPVEPAQPGTIRARIDATAPVDASALEGQVLSLMVHDSTAQTPFRATFTHVESCDDVAAQIEAAYVTAPVAGRITASCEDEVLSLEAVEPGPNVRLGVVSGSALDALGLTARTYTVGG